MAAISKQEYLKRYLSNADDEKKKKKRKKPKTTSKFMRSVIVDDDVGLDALKPSKEIQNYEEELQAFDEAPTVFDEDGVTAISAESFRKREEEKKTKWAPVNALQKGELEPSFRSDKDLGDVDVLPSRKGRHDSSDPSPLRDSEKKQTFSASPIRRVRHDSSDSSPPRKANVNGNFERRKKPSSITSSPGLDQSPHRNRRHDSPDNSPPRRKQQRSQSMDLSPQRMKPHRSPNLSPVRKKYLGSPDNSPPRRRKQMIDSPEMLSHRAKQNTSCDLSPPRKVRHDSSDISPLRRRRQSISPDLSPPRHKLSGELSPYGRRTNFHNNYLSPHHQRLRHDSDESPPRQRNPSPRSPVNRGIKREREKESEIKTHQGELSN